MQTLKEALVQRKIVPNKDIQNNTITENSFAVGFNAVIQGSGDDIYTNPDTFFSLCLLYTSDAADDLLCVDLGGRRIIKKKKKPHPQPKPLHPHIISYNKP